MLLTTEDLTKVFRNRAVGKAEDNVAVDKANLSLNKGETVGLFGDSGSGKSTLGLMVSGLPKPTSGYIRYDGMGLVMPYKGEQRRKIQILFQHPETSFNPALILLRSMTEPYRLFDPPCTIERLLADLEPYGLYEEHLYRRPDQLSGGELQRAALARLLTIKPEVIVLDEPTSMLDVITQAQIMAMLKRYQREHHTAYLLISHNRPLCEQMCDRIYQVHHGVFSSAPGFRTLAVEDSEPSAATPKAASSARTVPSSDDVPAPRTVNSRDNNK